MFFGLRYDTPVYILEVIVTSYLKIMNKNSIALLILKIAVSKKNKVSSRYILAEILQTPSIQDFIDELSLPFLPFLVKRFTGRYAVSGNNTSNKKEHLIYLLTALKEHIDFDTIINNSDLSDSFFWLAYRQQRRTYSMTFAIEREQVLIAEALAHPGSKRRKHMKHLLYCLIQFKHGEKERALKAYTSAMKIMKDELAWIEMIEVFQWMEIQNTDMNDLVRMDAAWVFFQQGQYNVALLLYQKVWLKDKDEESFRKQVRCLERLGERKKAIGIALDHISLILDSYGIAKLLRTIGWCYVMEGDAKKALKYSFDAMNIFNDNKPMSKDIRYNIARTHNNIGAAYELEEKLNKSAKHHKISIQIMKRLAVWKWVSGSLLNSSIVLRKKRSFKRSIKEAREAKTIKHAIMDTDEMPVVLFNEALSLIAFFIAKDNKKSLSDAIQSLVQAYNIRVSQNSKKQIGAILSLGYIVYILDADKAFDDSICLLKSFEDYISYENFNEYELDKRPLIAKAILLQHLVKNQKYDVTLMAIANGELELPNVEKLLTLGKVNHA